MVLVCLGVVPFALSGSLAAETASARERNRNEENVCTVWDKVRGSQDVVQEREGLEGSFQGGHEDGGRWERGAARFQGFGGCFCGGGACRFGVHEDGWMRWVAVEPCHLELRVSRIPIPHSPFSIWLTYGHWAQGQRGLPAVRDRPKYRRPPPTSQTTEDSCYLLYTRHSHVWPRLIFAQDFPRTQQQVPIQSPGPTIKANQARQPRPKPS